MVAILPRPNLIDIPVAEEGQSTSTRELVALCPQCKAFETLSFVNGRLVQTRKFSQYGGEIYHDCGCNQPCRLYRTC
ncbi:MAG: hypothetical protein ABIH70_09710 [Chloroflexota bacterium]